VGVEGENRAVARRRRPARSTLVLRWLGASVLAAIALAYVQPLRAYLGARHEVAKSEAAVTALERRNRSLERRVELAGTDAFVEREARRLGLVRPGERLFIVQGTEQRKKPTLR
jgi:cell division protein FtsB